MSEQEVDEPYLRDHEDGLPDDVPDDLPTPPEDTQEDTYLKKQQTYDSYMQRRSNERRGRLQVYYTNVLSKEILFLINYTILGSMLL